MNKKKKTTTTANISSFQHKLGGNPEEGNCPDGEIWDAERQMCVPYSGKKQRCGEEPDTEFTYQTDRSDSRVGGVWSYEEPELREHPLNEPAGGDACKLQECSVHYPLNLEECGCLSEATVSGQGAASSPKVAGTDTRFGGPTFEPVFFEEPSKENNMIRNEKVFYNNDNEAVLLPGWEYLSDYAERTESNRIKVRTKTSSLRFREQEIEDPEIEPENVDSLELDDEGIDAKKKKGIAWDLAGPGDIYKEHLRRLRKIHNI